MEQRYYSDGQTQIVTTELDTLANGSGASSAAFDNSTVKATHALLELLTTFGTNPTDGSIIEIFARLAPNGTDYSSAEVSSLAPMRVGQFSLKNNTSAQRCNCVVPMFPFETIFYFVNRSGQTMGSTNDVFIYPYGYEGV